MSFERRQRLEAMNFEWDLLESAWDKRFAALRQFKAREGHCQVPRKHVEGDYRLGQWVGDQRKLKDRMSTERRQKLDALGFEWDILGSAWELGFAALERFKAREHHCRVIDRHIEGTFRLGSWVANQRYLRDSMPIERRQRLDDLGFEWDPLISAWEKGFSVLEQFKAREGHCRVPNNHIEDTFNLGAWVGNQRRHRVDMPAERRGRLEGLGFEWDMLASSWEEGFAALERFKARENHCRVPRPHLEGNFRLGQWVGTMRRRQDSIPLNRRQRLEALGFEWDPVATDWEEWFTALQRFKDREHHCRVPQRHIEGSCRLGAWVANQRSLEDSMPVERKERLDALGFVWRAAQLST